MNIGVIKERKHQENRVALQPIQVKELINHGHNVFVEKEAGVNSGFSDKEYLDNGAVIANKLDILDKCKLLLKVKAPLENEYKDFKKDHILFTYLHFDENILPEKIKELIKTGFLGIAYEWVEVDNDYPLLRPMSKLTGYLFAQKSLEFLARYKGKLAGEYEDYLNPSIALVIGLGTIGLSSTKYFSDNNIKVIIVDKNIENIKNKLTTRFGEKESNKICNSIVKTINFNSDDPNSTVKEIDKEISNVDILFNCAVRRSNLPKEKLEFIVTKEMVNKMQKGSVVADTTGCDKDLFETCISSESLEEYEVIDGIVHYNCDHIPSLVGNTATKLLTDKTFPYILELANKGEKAILDNYSLYKGASCYKANITHKYTAEKKGLTFLDIKTLINY